MGFTERKHQECKGTEGAEGARLMPKVCGAGIPLRSLIKATSGNTMPFRNPFGLGHQQGCEGGDR